MSDAVHEQRRALGRRLREMRKDAGLTGRRLASMAGWHESKVSKIETGDRSPSEADLRAYCLHADAGDQLPDLVAAVRNVEAAHLEWRRILHAGTGRRQARSVALAEQTKLMRIYEPVVIPGILQTAEYAEAMLRRSIEFYGVPDDVEQGVSKRMERQRFLYRGEHRFHILIAEQSLSTTVGDRSVMAGQFDRLLAVMGLPRVLLGIVPAESEWRAPATSFVMFDERMVLVEAVSAELTITQPREIAIYQRAFGILAGQSVTGEAARSLIRTAMNRRQDSS
ncbi:helix-turn-helix domain-containing protein [Nocardia sp. NPDC003345]